MKYFLGFLACALVVSLSNGQSNSGNIQGTVSDSTGAALPKATVTVRNLDTGATVSTETTDAGLYSAPNLPPGRYALTVEAPNFKKYVREGVTVPTGTTVTLDIQMQLGMVSENVVVSADASQLESATSRQRSFSVKPVGPLCLCHGRHDPDQSRCVESSLRA